MTFRCQKSTLPRCKVTVFRTGDREGHTAYSSVLRERLAWLSLAFRPPLAYVRARPTGLLVRSRVQGRERRLLKTSGTGVAGGHVPQHRFAFPRRAANLLRTLAQAFGLAGGSAIKTGGYNRLAGNVN